MEDVPLVSFPETWAAWGFSREDVGRLFRAAAAYYGAQPWDVFADNEPVAATLADGVEWHAVIMGTAGKECGLALYADAQDLLVLHFLQHTERAMFGARGAVLHLGFSPARDVPPHMRREVRAAKWEIAGPAAYPMLMALNTPGGGAVRCDGGVAQGSSPLCRHRAAQLCCQREEGEKMERQGSWCHSHVHTTPAVRLGRSLVSTSTLGGWLPPAL